MHMRRFGNPLFICILSLLLALPGCMARSTPSTAPTTTSLVQEAALDWPTREWPVSTPQAQGMDAGRLAELLAEIDRRGLALHSLLIIRKGAIVSETYYGNDGADERHEQYSVTKSFVSTLIGIALDRGLIQSVDQPVLELLPQYAALQGATAVGTPDLHQKISLEHVLTMTSGLGWSETDAGFMALYQSDDWPAFMLALPVVETPGAQFDYCSGCSHLLIAVVEGVAEDGTLEFVRQNLFEPLGITGWTWEQDADGIPIGGWGLRLTPRDMAKLGYLYLRGGEWDGRQIVSSEWVAQATQRHIRTEDERGYGYQWWIDADGEGYAALGRNGQMIYVRPGADLIVVTTAGSVEHDQIYRLIEDYVLPAIASGD